MNLIVQHTQPLALAHIKTLTAMARGTAATCIDPYALRVTEIDLAQRDEIRAYCALHRLDCAFVRSLQLTEFKLVAMDMDSTLIAIECLDEIADYCGLKPEVAAITAAAMRGEIDFDQSLKRRVALLKGTDAQVLERVLNERLRLSPGAHQMLAGIHSAGLRTLLVSAGFTFFAHWLKAHLGIDEVVANTLEVVHADGKSIDRKLTGNIIGEIVNAETKGRVLRDLCAQMNIEPSHVIAIGDGANDLKMMAAAGLSVAFRAKPVVRKAAHVSFDFVGLDGLLRLFE